MARKNYEVKSELIRDINEDTDQVKKFIYILIGVAVVAGLLYLLTSKVLIKDNYRKISKGEPVEETIAYDGVSVGNVFNRPYDEYYVIAYDSTANDASKYAFFVSSATTSDKKKVYYLDLSLGINAEYMGDANSSAADASELSFAGPTLIKIKNQKIVKYIENYDDMASELK